MEVPAHVQQLLAALRAGGFVACPVGAACGTAFWAAPPATGTCAPAPARSR